MTTSAAASLRIVHVGVASTIQDDGRHGWSHLGVPTAGPVDRRAHDEVNRLVGNHPGAATIETLGGLIVEAIRPVIVARSTDASRHTLGTGDRLQIDPPADAVWAYLAVRGGVESSEVLGSRSHDTLAGIGPPPLTSDMTVSAGADPGTELVADLAPLRRTDGAIRLWSGPQHDWFIGGCEALIGRTWLVTHELSRVGVRLGAGIFERSTRWRPQMPSIGLVEGAVQITPAGEPMVMLANHPTTGGYPVIAVVEPDDLSRLVQTRPGSSIRFRSAARFSAE